ncbi:hypothetical protein NEMBOFW57_006139 [Staphylotrichum longicolle]|uniref:thioredoxin-dependent peroxiredoxin n=1 Tax=Staphylotrichum longicolle TaxID=669026 RepID=A0AAD4F2S7_9PEZI|nr:hypothetical protein NEMBOFW57_006139 [Staphylotrichum longicolle]
MPMELRKRKAAPAPAPAPAKKSKPTKVTKTAAKVKETVKETAEKVAEVAAAATTTTTTNGNGSSSSSSKPAVGDTITLDGFGGEIETNDGTKTTLKALVDASKSGVVLFTYPKASTPGCTRQACLFRDAYASLSTASGLALYGLSTDSPKANTTFKDKQKLPYPLLCDPAATLIGAIGLKKAPKGTTRGVFVVDKAGKVLAAQPGGPEGTVAVVKAVVEGLGSAGEGEAAVEDKGVEAEEKKAEERGEEAEDVKKADPEVEEKEEEAKENGVEKKAEEVKENGKGEAEAKEESAK